MVAIFFHRFLFEGDKVPFKLYIMILLLEPYKIPGIPGGGSGGIQIGPNYFASKL